MSDEKFDRVKANTKIDITVSKILDEELPLLKEKIRKLCTEVTKAKYIIYIFSIALFIVGLFFLITAFSLIFSFGPEEWKNILEALGFGGASATSFVVLMLLHPMKKIQKVNSDAAQAEMIYENWEIGVLLYIRAMDIENRESIKEAAKNIRNHTASAVRMLEKFIETEIEGKQQE